MAPLELRECIQFYHTYLKPNSTTNSSNLMMSSRIDPLSLGEIAKARCEVQVSNPRYGMGPAGEENGEREVKTDGRGEGEGVTTELKMY